MARQVYCDANCGEPAYALITVFETGDTTAFCMGHFMMFCAAGVGAPEGAVSYSRVTEDPDDDRMHWEFAPGFPKDSGSDDTAEASGASETAEDEDASTETEGHADDGRANPGIQHRDGSPHEARVENGDTGS